ncbi:MAG TPA: aminotransferase class III-fold pyridoxal phosphate-dependent enzyme, partial [Candidatus Binatia bacterium]|nr:aminotransferase class III-fold pyridoxal phosphate-dependent enzyme [Candidatus Binatia bacterium]
HLWAHEPYGVAPDLMSVAKPLAGGLPIGATLMREAIAQVIHPGDHGSTFAGGPLVCRAAEVVLGRINQPDMLEQVRQKGAYLCDALRSLQSPLIREVRGRGLLLGVELSCEVRPLLQEARDRGLLVINAGDNVLRLCPPLIIEREDIDRAVSILEQCLQALERAN